MSTITGFDLYRAYCATKLHYGTKAFSVVTKGIPKNLSRSSFEQRTDQQVFNRVAKMYEYVPKQEVIPFLASSLFYNKNLWIGELLEFEELAKKRWMLFREFRNNPVGVFRSELTRNTSNPISFFSLEGKEAMPEVINKVVSEQIHPSVLVIYDLINAGWFESICQKGQEDYNNIMESVGMRLMKHKQLHSYSYATLNQCNTIISNLSIS